MLGITLKVISVAVFLLMSTGAKSLPQIPLGQLVFFRSFFAILPIIIILQLRGELGVSLKTKRVPAHLLRTFVGISGMSLLFVAIINLPLPEAITLSYSIPLMIVVLSAIILKERVRMFRWTAVAVGAIGVLTIAWPRLTLLTSGAPLDNAESLGLICAITGAFFAACAMLATRSLVTTERSGTVVLYYSSFASIIALCSLAFGWVMPTPLELAMLIGIGISGGIGQILLTESYRHADMSIIAPFEYSSLILSIAIGYLVFGDLPTINMIVGGLIVVAAGIAIILRERHLGLKRRARAKRVSSPQG